MAGLVNATSKISGAGAVTGFSGDENEREGSRFEDNRGNFEKAEEYGKNVGIDARMRSTSTDKVRLEMTIPKEPVVGLRTQLEMSDLIVPGC